MKRSGREVIARLEDAGRARATATVGRRQDGVFETVDQAVKAAARRSSEGRGDGLEERGKMNAIIRRICADNADEWRASNWRKRKSDARTTRAMKLRNIRLCAGRRVHEDRRQFRCRRVVPGRVRALGRDRNGAARDAFRPHDGQQRHQHSGGRQYRGVQSSPGRRQSARRADCKCSIAKFSAKSASPTSSPWPARRPSRTPSRSSSIPCRAALRDRRTRRGEGGDEVRQARDRGRSRQSARRGRRDGRPGRGGEGHHPGARRSTTTCSASARRKYSWWRPSRTPSSQPCGAPARRTGCARHRSA